MKFVLWTGDQVYADYPEQQSLFTAHPDLLAWERERVRALWHSRYRSFWGLEAWKALQADFTGYPMLDDHELVDNYGSFAHHGSEEWRELREGARAAYVDYQHARIADADPWGEGAYDYGFTYGSAAVYVMDTRSRRMVLAGGAASVYDRAQLDALATWLEAHALSRVLLLVLPVPLFFIPRWAAWLVTRFPGRFREDGSDRWSHPKFHDDRVQLLNLLRSHQLAHPHQTVVLVSGDVHVGYVMRCYWRSTPDAKLYQFVSSAITHEMSPLSFALTRHVPRADLFASAAPGRAARLQLMGGLRGQLRQPVAALNVGVIDVDLSGEEPKLGFRLMGERDGEPVCLFRAQTDEKP